VYRRLADIPPPRLDVVDVFRKPSDLAGHLDDIIAANPKVVWLQSGISEPEFEAAVAAAGIKVVANRWGSGDSGYRAGWCVVRGGSVGRERLIADAVF
jgi:predicted CoA-binding protein